MPSKFHDNGGGGVIGRPFLKQVLVIDITIEEDEIKREDQVTQDLMQAWEVLVNQHIQK